MPPKPGWRATNFEVVDAKSYREACALICFFDCLHRSPDPQRMFTLAGFSRLA
jgi:hypothetical protein